MLLAIKIYFNKYDSDYVLIEALVKNKKCYNVMANQRTRDHCVFLLEYVYDNKLINSRLQIIGNKDVYEGDNIIIRVNKENPIEISVPYVSNDMMSSIIFIISFLTIISAFGIRYIKF
jgi:hypothetical protein